MPPIQPKILHPVCEYAGLCTDLIPLCLFIHSFIHSKQDSSSATSQQGHILTHLYATKQVFIPVGKKCKECFSKLNFSVTPEWGYKISIQYRMKFRCLNWNRKEIKIVFVAPLVASYNGGGRKTLTAEELLSLWVAQHVSCSSAS